MLFEKEDKSVPVCLSHHFLYLDFDDGRTLEDGLRISKGFLMVMANYQVQSIALSSDASIREASPNPITLFYLILQRSLDLTSSQSMSISS
jgi:hypothetical protein